MQLENNTPLVAVYMITYNHENYISEAIDSVLMQQTNFSYKLFIGEDFSTDNTRTICNDYANKYPDKIELVLHKTNIGAIANAQSIYKKCSESGAKYVAMLEGDDYWTDQLKLQKQVDFLEDNEDFGSCFHSYIEYFEDTKSFSREIKPSHLVIDSSEHNGMILTDDSFFKEWYTQVLTAMIRTDIITSITQKNIEFKKFRDNHLIYFLLKNKKSICFPWSAAVYRKHSGGIYSGISHKKNFIEHFFIYEELYDKTKDKRFHMQTNNMLSELLKNYSFTELTDFYQEITLYSFKQKVLWHYPKEEKVKVFKTLPLKEKTFIIKEYIKRLYARF